MFAKDSKFDLQVLPGLEAIEPPEEVGVTFGENAELKAAYYSSFTGSLVLADDSGLEVDALDGAPGVFSARYAGPQATGGENNLLLLQNLARISARQARFVSVIAVAQHGHTIARARGIVEGIILEAARGSAGFGYDPLFFHPPSGRSFGELSDAEKLRVSARGIALRAIFERLGSVL